mgnify:CR=1 FL=1
MNAKVLRVLEYDKVIHMLEQKATSDPGRQLCRDLVPMTDLAQIEQAQTETADALTRIFQKGSLNFGSNKPLGMCLRSLEIGSTLSSEELLRIAGLLENTARVKNFGRSDKDEEQQDSLTEYFHCLEPLAPLSKEIRRCIIDVDEIADDASPALKKIRRSMVLTGEKIHNQLNSMVNGSVRNYLQDAVITTRDGRYCIPVKAEYKGQVPGMVHDQSSTGSTFFIEPAAVVSLNNQLRELEIEEQKEIAVILANLSAEAGAHTLEIAENQRIMTQLDFIFAKASLAMDQNASRPLFNDEHIVRIRQGRHPLLDRKKVVPIDVELGKNFDLLVITGPNTGGKTVCLKTVGLFTLMGQAGLHIPALDRSQLSVFTEVFADIGDEQSIEQSLSTFSGHMKKITGILELAMPHTLVLLDELGAGTDPAEGAALAVAIIEELRRRGVLLMATTHYAELKVFALETKGVVNASCEFDLETLRPTYKLSVGVPGKSNAFLISEKLGIPSRVIEAAQQHLSAEDKRLDAVLGQLDDLKLQLKESQNEVEQLRNEASHQLEAARKKRDELIQQGENELEAARAKARTLAQQVETQAYALTDELRQLQKDERMSAQQKAQRAREIAKKETEKLFAGTEVVHNPVKEFVPLKDVKVGQEVCIAELNQLATVLALPDKNGDVLVRAGIIKTKVPLKGLKQPEKLVKESTAPKTKAQQRYSRLTGDTNRPNGRVERVQRTAKMECNLLGLTVDEALSEVDSFIDRAILNGQTVVYLIHGNGTGALRTAIHKHLRGNRMVKSFRLGRYGEGESGVTVVELK